MIILSKEQVLKLHASLIKATGGSKKKKKKREGGGRGGGRGSWASIFWVGGHEIFLVGVRRSFLEKKQQPHNNTPPPRGGPPK